MQREQPNYNLFKYTEIKFEKKIWSKTQNYHTTQDWKEDEKKKNIVFRKTHKKLNKLQISLCYMLGWDGWWWSIQILMLADATINADVMGLNERTPMPHKIKKIEKIL